MYSLLTTEVNRAMHPGLRGYSPMLTRNTQGVRGMGKLAAMPNITFAVGPGGQFQVGAESVPTATSLWDQVKSWAGESTLIAGVPNSLIGIAGVVFGLSFLLPGRRR